MWVKYECAFDCACTPLRGVFCAEQMNSLQDKSELLKVEVSFSFLAQYPTNNLHRISLTMLDLFISETTC